MRQDNPAPASTGTTRTKNEVKNTPDEPDTDDEDISIVTATTSVQLSEHDLYPILIDYLKSELKLYCLRIDEKRSKNSRGSGGNRVASSRYSCNATVDKNGMN